MKAFSLSVAVAVALSVAAVGAAVAAGHSTSRAAKVSIARTGLGRVVVAGRGRTLYLFEKDKRGRSLIGRLRHLLAAPAHARQADRRRRSEAVAARRDPASRRDRQVTYAGHPLYRFALDTRRGQTKGEGLDDFGGGWYVLAPSGKKIENGDD